MFHQRFHRLREHRFQKPGEQRSSHVSKHGPTAASHAPACRAPIPRESTASTASTKSTNLHGFPLLRDGRTPLSQASPKLEVASSHLSPQQPQPCTSTTSTPTTLS